MKKTLQIAALVVIAANLAIATAPAIRDVPDSASLPLGGKDFAGWTGLEVQQGHAALGVPGTAAYRVSDGKMGAHTVGLVSKHDGTLDMRGWYAIRFDVRADRDEPLQMDLTLRIPLPQEGRRNFTESTSASLRIAGKGWQTVTVPLAQFDYQRGAVNFLKFIKDIDISAEFVSGAKGSVDLRNLRLVSGDVISLHANLRSAPADPGRSVTYPVQVTNASETPQLVSLRIRRDGWEAFTATVSPESLMIPAGGTAKAEVTVTVPDNQRTPPGAHENQVLVATTAAGAVQELDFITLRRMPFPYLTFSNAEWEKVREKSKTVDWARKDAEEIIKNADAWEVPSVKEGTLSDRKVPALFRPYIAERNVSNAARAWKLTGEKKYAEKTALFLKRFSDPETGYPATLQATTGDIPQEGGFFENCLAAYDLIQDAGVLTDDDRKQIENSFRLYADVIIDMMGAGEINNWLFFNLNPAAVAALAVQDLKRFETILEGPTGIKDQLRYGVMDDGWWNEMSLSYNIGCFNTTLGVALAAQPFGYDLLNEKIPNSYTDKIGLRPFEEDQILGMSFTKYGPVKKNHVTLKDMADGIAIYPDYRGIMFGIGDGHETLVSADTFDRAYFAFRDPKYASILRGSKDRDLIYGVPELPEGTADLFRLSGHSDNAGVAVLRSQTPGRQPSEQIQVVTKYGTHGGYHGHYDRLSLLSLMRHGRSFYNPQASWFGYGSPMYKMWVQPSLSHNMVVVDGKQQVPSDCKPLLFHSGPLLQVQAAETTTKWSNPPFLGGYDVVEKIRKGDAPFIPVTEDHPKIGAMTGYTGPVRSRRAVIVTDDFVVIADDQKASDKHTFDNLLQLRGVEFANPEAARFLRHDAQFDTDPLSSGQFITDVNRFQTKTPLRIDSTFRFGSGEGSKYWDTGGKKSLSEPGVLKLDAWVLWPTDPEIAIGAYAEAREGGKPISYEVRADGLPLASGRFGAWILGSGTIDVDTAGAKMLELRISTKRPNRAPGTAFWTDSEIVMADGRKIPLRELPAAPDGTPRVVLENVIEPEKPGLDYEGGPVRIAGNPAKSAIAAEPQDDGSESIVRVNLEGLAAVRFRSGVGGDWPVGPEEQLRRTVAIRSTGTQAQFLTLIEPFEEKRMVKTAAASGPGKLRVTLVDGRELDMTIDGLSSEDGAISVELVEKKDGKVLRQETAR